MLSDGTLARAAVPSGASTGMILFFSSLFVCGLFTLFISVWVLLRASSSI